MQRKLTAPSVVHKYAGSIYYDIKEKLNAAINENTTYHHIQQHHQPLYRIANMGRTKITLY
jgi:hypothetical protein